MIDLSAIIGYSAVAEREYRGQHFIEAAIEHRTTTKLDSNSRIESPQELASVDRDPHLIMSNNLYMCGFGRRCGVDSLRQIYPEDFLSMLNSVFLVSSDKYMGVESRNHNVNESVHVLIETPRDLEHTMELMTWILVWNLSHQLWCNSVAPYVRHEER